MVMRRGSFGTQRVFRPFSVPKSGLAVCRNKLTAGTQFSRTHSLSSAGLQRFTWEQVENQAGVPIALPSENLPAHAARASKNRCLAGCKKNPSAADSCWGCTRIRKQRLATQKPTAWSASCKSVRFTRTLPSAPAPPASGTQSVPMLAIQSKRFTAHSLTDEP